MSRSFVLIILFTSIMTNSFCQGYVIDMEERNKMIERLNQAIGYIDSDKIDEAYSLLTSIVEKDSLLRPTYLHLYKIYTLKNDYSKSVIQYLRKAQRIYQEDDEITFYIGEIYRMSAELDNAINEYNLAIQYSKKNGEDFQLTKSYYFNRGNCYMKLNQIDSALADYNYSLKLDPNNPNALFNRGICFFKKGVKADACKDWNQSLILGNNNAQVYIEKYCK